jgi:peptidylprolyl isomerase
VPTIRRAGCFALVAVLAFVTVACGGDDDSRAEKGDTQQTTCTESRSKPDVTLPDAPPTTLKTKDLIEGKGAVAEPGKVLTVHYVGVMYTNKQQLDASWDRNQPYTFVLGTDPVIQGWQQGIEGMKVCGRRQLDIPSDLAYGPQGRPPVPPNEPLVFVVDLMSVQ